ncbi:hypothetical protein, partial [Helicobacter suis]|uniref:hypothetical protein n=1 Tax=Helicobacter suis TaxID=104628 RepID=UPI001967CBCE
TSHHQPPLKIKNLKNQNANLLTLATTIHPSYYNATTSALTLIALTLIIFNPNSIVNIQPNNKTSLQKTSLNLSAFLKFINDKISFCF